MKNYYLICLINLIEYTLVRWFYKSHTKQSSIQSYVSNAYLYLQGLEFLEIDDICHFNPFIQ